MGLLSTRIKKASKKTVIAAYVSLGRKNLFVNGIVAI